MTFFSYPGASHRNTNEGLRRRPSVKDMADANPNWAQWRKDRDSNPLQSIGMEIGELCKSEGEPAKLLHEEANSDGSITHTLQRSQAEGSGTVEATWVPDGPTKTRLTKTRQIHS